MCKPAAPLSPNTSAPPIGRGLCAAVMVTVPIEVKAEGPPPSTRRADALYIVKSARRTPTPQCDTPAPERPFAAPNRRAGKPMAGQTEG